jgi:hypothetical protein
MTPKSAFDEAHAYTRKVESLKKRRESSLSNAEKRINDKYLKAESDLRGIAQPRSSRAVVAGCERAGRDARRCQAETGREVTECRSPVVELGVGVSR